MKKSTPPREASSENFAATVRRWAEINGADLYKKVNYMGKLAASFAVSTKTEKPRFAPSPKGKIQTALLAKYTGKRKYSTSNPAPGIHFSPRSVGRKPKVAKGKLASELRGTVVARLHAMHLAMKLRSPRVLKPGENIDPQTAAEFYRGARQLLNKRVRSRGYLRAGQIPALRMFQAAPDGGERPQAPEQNAPPGGAKLATPERPEASFFNDAREVGNLHPKIYEEVIAEVRVQVEKYLAEDLQKTAAGMFR